MWFNSVVVLNNQPSTVVVVGYVVVGLAQYCIIALWCDVLLQRDNWANCWWPSRAGQYCPTYPRAAKPAIFVKFELFRIPPQDSAVFENAAHARALRPRYEHIVIKGKHTHSEEWWCTWFTSATHVLCLYFLLVSLLNKYSPSYNTYNDLQRSHTRVQCCSRGCSCQTS